MTHHTPQSPVTLCKKRPYHIRSTQRGLENENSEAGFRVGHIPEPLGLTLEEGYAGCGTYILLPPPPTEKVHQCWQDDELFAYQFVNGANPMLLRRSTSLPSRLALPSGMEELRAQLEKELQVPLLPLPGTVLSLVVW